MRSRLPRREFDEKLRPSMEDDSAPLSDVGVRVLVVALFVVALLSAWYASSLVD